MATDSSDLDLEEETDRLYQRPLDGFVEARNALAARLKSKGDKDGAARVKALARPTVSAWAVNQVHWNARPELDALLASVERLQAAQLRGTGGAELREAMKARRDAQGVVLRRAAGMLTSAGHGANPGTLQRVANTLDALAAAGAPAHACPGRLAEDLEPPGFGAFAAMAEAAPPAPRPTMALVAHGANEPVTHRPVAEGGDVEPSEPARAGRAETEDRLRAVLEEAERRLDRARRDAREAAGALSVAEKRAEGARDELEDATRRFERAKERLAALAADEAAARGKAEQVIAARDAAENERAAALVALRAVEPAPGPPGPPTNGGTVG